MDPRLLHYYNQELRHVRDMGAEFAREFPKIAGRLGMEGIDCSDPYVERLLEGFAFLAARVQLKIDAEFPRFTQHLLEMVYPGYLAPTPAMAVVQLQPDLREPALATGVTVPRGAVLHSMVGRDTTASCEFRLANDVELWPIEMLEAKVLDGPAALGAIGVRSGVGARSALRLSFRCTAGVQVRQLALAELPLYLVGADSLPAELYAHVLGSGSAVLVRGTGNGNATVSLGREAIQRMGYGDDEALLPPARRQFSGYRLLQEYFAFPQRFLFLRLAGLRRGLQQISGDRFELIVLCEQGSTNLEAVGADNFRLFCGGAVNLFPRSADRIHIEAGVPEYHVVVDRTRPMDIEVYDVQHVQGFGDRSEPEREFRPFYACNEQTWHSRDHAYFTVRREARRLSSRQRQSGPRTGSYVGSEVFLSLVDPDEAPFSSNLRQLAATTLCTNRDLPLGIPIAKSASDFTLESAAPVERVRCVAGLSKPRQSLAHGDASWRLVSQLSLNYLSLLDTPGEGAAALREMLGLYANPSDPVAQRQIEGVRAIASKAVIGRVPVPGPIAYGRGTEITLTLEDAAFQGSNGFALAAVLEEFFARYASINSFSKTVLRSVERGEVARWPMRLGNRPTL